MIHYIIRFLNRPGAFSVLFVVACMERGLASTGPTGVMVLGHCWRVDA